MNDLRNPDHTPASEEIMMQLQQMLVARETSRRSNNNLLKPLSDIDMNQFSKQDRVTPKYYRLP
jgi:hypothetical protein